MLGSLSRNLSDPLAIVRVTVPAKPLDRVSVTVTSPAVPWVIDLGSGVTGEISNDGVGTAVTVRLRVVVAAVIPAPVPRMVSGKVPGVTEPPT